MPQTTSPDLRLFEATAAKDHAIYDSALVQVHSDYSNWTRPKCGDAPFTLDHFRYDTQKRLAKFLSTLPDEGLTKGIAKQDLSDRRILLQHLANSWIDWWGGLVHTSRMDEHTALIRVRNNMSVLAKEKKLVIENKDSPLSQHHNANLCRIGDGYYPVIALKSEDVALSKYIAGQNPHINSRPEDNQHTRNIIAQVQPFLVDIDDSQIEYPLLGLRQKLREILSGEYYLTDELRCLLVQEIVDDWAKTYVSGIEVSSLDEIEDEIKVETGIANILKKSESEILEECFGKLLDLKTIDEKTKRKLLKRKPVFEYIIYDAITRKDTEAIRKAYSMFHRWSKAANEHFGAFGHLGLIMAAHATDVDLRNYQEVILT